MTDTITTDFATFYLDQLQQLAAEVRVAISAIAANNLPSLEESVARQETLCATLSTLCPEAATQRFPVHMAERIRSATLAVQTLNLQYGSLLRHSGRSRALLAALYHSQAGDLPSLPQSDHPFTPARHTFTCEI